MEDLYEQWPAMTKGVMEVGKNEASSRPTLRKILDEAPPDDMNENDEDGELVLLYLHSIFFEHLMHYSST